MKSLPNTHRGYKVLEILLIVLMMLAPELILPQKAWFLKSYVWAIVTYCVLHFHLVKMYEKKLDEVKIRHWWILLVILFLPVGLIISIAVVSRLGTIVYVAEIFLYVLLFATQTKYLFGSKTPKAPSS